MSGSAAVSQTGEPRICDRFLAVCRDRPTATAIVHSSGSWTYAQIDAASSALARQLLARDATDDVVALYSHRSAELVIGMLACARAGLTFAVLDAGYPVERIELLLGVLRPGRFVSFGTDLPLRDLPAGALRVDDAATLLTAPVEPAAPRRADIAYLLFTSGTTGVPKCIATSHAPLVHFIDWYERAFAVDSSCRFSMLSGLGHDPVLRDVFVPLSIGAELHIPPPSTLLDPAALYRWLADARITHAHVTPQLSRIMCAGRRDRAPLGSLRFVCSGGDTLRSKQAIDLRAVAPAVAVVNFYGSTETPQAMASHVFDPALDAEVVPIGRGIDDVELLVLSDTLEVCAPNTRGQIAIRTRYLSDGYRGDPALTDKKFVANPRSSDPTDRLYLTGDLGHARPDGAIVLAGRLDDQFKIRGFRVELGDVVHQLQRLAHVEDAVVLAERLADGESRLVAYLIGDGETTAVREAMAATAPAYMVPASVVWLDRFPLLPNGKLDRVALAKLEPETSPQDLDPVEAAIVASWCELLTRRTIDVDASFVELGGDSLSFIEVSVALEGLLGHLPVRWERLSIRELARTRQARRSRWTTVDASVLLRAISIVSIVADHFDLPELLGSVVALLVVSGMSFGRYVVPQIQQTGRVTPIFRMLGKIVIPTVLYTLAVNLAFHRPVWPGLFLVNNLVDPDYQVSGVGFWYLDILVQCLLVLALLLAIRPIRTSLLSRDPFYYLLGATLLFEAVALLAPYALDTTQLADRVPQHFIRALVLGWTLIHATTTPRKLLVMAVAIGTFADFIYFYDGLLVLPFAATALLLAFDRVPLPLMLGRLVNMTASASLFIYLTDHQVGAALEKLGLHPIVMVPIAVIVGIAAWKLWESASHAVLGAVRRRDRPDVPGS